MKTIGATYTGNGNCVFTVWAPEKESVTLHIVHPTEQELPMQPKGLGYFQLDVASAEPGTRYFYKLDDEHEYPDPASHFQPEDVHGPSEVIDQSAYQWHDQAWRGLPFRDLIFYELHVGTFTPEGTFEAIIERLDDLAEVGINALELMPVCQFPGGRNWGYDGVYPYSVQHSYGGPDGLKKLVDACHARGIAVFLDVVYNHMGPEGNHFSQFGPYFTSKYCTPWGDALNFDGVWADGVRDFFANNALFWLEQYHIDGLRLDATHEVFDMSAVSIWELMHDRVSQLEQRLGRSLYVVAESDLNSPKVVTPPALGGHGFNAQWLDDFHHSFFVLIYKDAQKRYVDFGRMEQLAKAYTDGFVFTGEYAPSRKRQFGRSSAGVPAERYVVFNLNHDQVGNLTGKERLSNLVNFDRQKIAAAAILLSPYVPLLFMGEEYADKTPFYYFISHSDQELIKAIREGRKEEFGSFNDGEEFPEPDDEATFTKSKIQWSDRTKGKHRLMLKWHQTLIQLRRSLAPLQHMDKSSVRVTVLNQAGFVLHRQTEDGLQHLACLFNLSDEAIDYTLPGWVNAWQKLLDSKEEQWQEDGVSSEALLPDQVQAGQLVRLSPCSVTVYSGKRTID
ncbi:malto-oligosyltrehalose trehalohydrolase [Spirosoma oryzicola]|uniref:malto-oligosyltrehalose trehalohydrolase n=1 Tax=Spirosoma oryzicola TaxID=2898794 RepID=UPI001E536C54|nr:malto-oligosyltrehalose trehalohydrolase [Spirosoma oryzicola]UHG93582.1 malto-oligosyltrehalose trehalohydrolase [Spirosoma oryzicola]